MIEASRPGLEVHPQGGSGAVHRLGRIPLRPPEHRSENPGLPHPVATILRPFTMFENDQAFPARTVGQPGGEGTGVGRRGLRRFTEGMQEASDPTLSRRNVPTPIGRGPE